MSRLGESIGSKLNIDFLRDQVIQNAYGNQNTPIATLDPRTLLIWYLFFGLFPWFVNNVVILFAWFLLVTLTTYLARIAPLVLVVFFVGVFSQTGYLLIVALFFGGNGTLIPALLVLTLKVSIVSLASVTVFSGLDPDQLASGLLYFKFPDQLTFSIAFAYRILPIMLEEYQHILLSYKLRGVSPVGGGLINNIKIMVNQVTVIMISFYPLILNTAKRSRTLIESLELKGYRRSMKNPKVRQIKLAHLEFKTNDLIFSLASFFFVMATAITSLYITL